MCSCIDVVIHIPFLHETRNFCTELNYKCNFLVLTEYWCFAWKTGMNLTRFKPTTQLGKSPAKWINLFLPRAYERTWKYTYINKYIPIHTCLRTTKYFVEPAVKCHTVTRFGDKVKRKIEATVMNSLTLLIGKGLTIM